MAKPVVLNVTLYLYEDAKGTENSYRMWAQLTALDFQVLEEHTKSGCILGQWFGSDLSILERVPGVAALSSREADVDAFEPLTARQMQRKAG